MCEILSFSRGSGGISLLSIGWIGSERDRVELIWPSERFGRLK